MLSPDKGLNIKKKYIKRALELYERDLLRSAVQLEACEKKGPCYLNTYKQNKLQYFLAPLTYQLPYSFCSLLLVTRHGCEAAAISPKLGEDYRA
jgi:hypothetical protein